MAYGDFFEFNGKTLEINEPEILLVREFDELWNDLERNKCKEDPTGQKRLLAKKELKFIWLMYNYRSPYRDYVNADKYDESVADSKLTKEELKDKKIIEACKKYQSLLVTRAHRLINQANETCDALMVFLKNVDLDERKDDGSLVHNHKNVMDSLSKVDKVIDNLICTQKRIEKENMDKELSIRGDSELGFFDRVR